TDSDGAVQLWLTRRVLQQLLPQVWELLGRTLTMPPNFLGQKHPGQSHEPIGSANDAEDSHRPSEADRRRQLWIEHELAMETSPPLDDELARERHPAAMQANPQSEGLLSRIHVSADERSVRFQFDGPQRSLQFAGSRSDAHRVLRMIWQVQANAAWHLLAPWEPEG
ncbi:MAG: hypothetical protein RL109_1647, partial [Pseudomonadota bacterium]